MIAKDQPISRKVSDLLQYWSKPTFPTWVQNAMNKARSTAADHTAVFDEVKVAF